MEKVVNKHPSDEDYCKDHRKGSKDSPQGQATEENTGVEKYHDYRQGVAKTGFVSKTKTPKVAPPACGDGSGFMGV